MSPSRASSATKSGSFFSSPLWKRVFSRSRTSPSFICATASCASGPMQSKAKDTGQSRCSDTAAASGFSEQSSSGPFFGRPKCDSRMSRPPRPMMSFIVGMMRSRRVVSVTRPLSTGKLRSTRSSTRLPATSTSSKVRNFAIVKPWPVA